MAIKSKIRVTDDELTVRGNNTVFEVVSMDLRAGTAVIFNTAYGYCSQKLSKLTQTSKPMTKKPPRTINDIKRDIGKSIQNLNDAGKEYLMSYNGTVLRKFMSSDEIKRCNRLVKLGLLCKGKSDDSIASVCYYVDSTAKSILE
jgi:hypothetical protein